MEEEKTNVNVLNVVKEKFNEKTKKVRKPRKPRKVVKRVGKKSKPKSPTPEPKSKTPSPPPPTEPRPILSTDLEERVKYVNKRLYFCKDEADKKRYEDYLVKLSKRKVINV